MHLTAATRNYQGYKPPFNKAVRKRSEALVKSRSGDNVQVLEDDESEADDTNPDATGVVTAGDPNHEK
ncbi:hypothetical protein CKM354_000516800 [Cercospora kikuchii]|uniref:Uncharacterized protein n=1 Tax=Cercospora kikuchii TaxID=84275 RepID=A0A9P3FGI0_9PEZI|nr:uncharacterized protein CKM354_000516800 [Cercospora kikuchii]GIZ41879.1 hypothetical protein CKM354_000516800 [Cercospora kikuchii]